MLSTEIKENKNSISFFYYSVASGNINSKTHVRREFANDITAGRFLIESSVTRKYHQ